MIADEKLDKLIRRAAAEWRQTVVADLSVRELVARADDREDPCLYSRDRLLDLGYRESKHWPCAWEDPRQKWGTMPYNMPRNAI